MIKKIKVFGITAIAFFLLSQTALASSDHLRLNSKGQLNPKACDKVGKVLINVNQKVVNDVDSGENGNNWAFDSFSRHIQVWQNNDGDPNTYCALVNYNGAKFDAVAGQESPGIALHTIGSDVHGKFDGGYRAIITGTLLSNPAWKTHGNLGTFDYQCDINGNCPGYVDWVGQYFNYTDFQLPWWGWIYTANDHHGQWVNASYGNSGDIF